MTGSADEDETNLVILHRHPQYADECMEILNAQWPRSKGLRLRSLRSSCDQFPTSLVLLRRFCTNNEEQEVIGHARVNVLPREENAVWIESVIIREDLRGKGYGSILMTKTEEFAKVCGFTRAYLSTHDQQKFYARLGYELCPPVCIYGGSVNRNIIPQQFILPPVSPNNIPSVYKASELCRMLSVHCSVSKGETTPTSLVDSNANSPKDCNSLSNIDDSPLTLSSQKSLSPPPSPLFQPISQPPPSLSFQPINPPPPPPPVPSSGPAPPPPPPPPPSKMTKDDIKKVDVSTASKMYMKKTLL